MLAHALQRDTETLSCYTLHVVTSGCHRHRKEAKGRWTNKFKLDGHLSGFETLRLLDAHLSPVFSNDV